MLALACNKTREDVPGFVRHLAEGRDGMSLVYMYHADSLKSGTSYQNSAHIVLKDHCEVDHGYGWVTIFILGLVCPHLVSTFHEYSHSISTSSLMQPLITKVQEMLAVR